MSRALAPLLACTLFSVACSGGTATTNTPVQRETAHSEILRVGARWQSNEEHRGLNSPPSPISVFERRIESSLEFSQGETQATEQLVIRENFELSDGRRFRCAAKTALSVQCSFGRRGAEAAVELSRPALILERACEPADFPEGSLEIPATTARFVMRGDRLVAFAPRLEKREYIPLP